VNRPIPFRFVPAICGRFRPNGAKLSPTARMCLGVFVSRWCGGDDVIAVTLAEIARDLDVAKRTAIAARNELLECGALVLIREGGHGHGVKGAYHLGESVKGAVTAPKKGNEAAPIKGEAIPGSRVQKVNTHRERRDPSRPRSARREEDFGPVYDDAGDLVRVAV
jgi:hypothetical protein